jgi:mRNA-degrading endonuclease YafQ of YafQ-DinJ toxin-antitoxin module
MEVLFSDSFGKSLKKHAAIREAVQRKVDMVIQDPVRFGEPLKGPLRGLYSCPVKRNFLILFLYCRTCRRKGDDEVVGCSDCHDRSDETIRFIELGPHDSAYARRPIRPSA